MQLSPKLLCNCKVYIDFFHVVSVGQVGLLPECIHYHMHLYQSLYALHVILHSTPDIANQPKKLDPTKDLLNLCIFLCD